MVLKSVVEVSRSVFRLGLEIFHLVGRHFLCGSMGRKGNGLVLGRGVQFGHFGTRIFLADAQGFREASAG